MKADFIVYRTRNPAKKIGFKKEHLYHVMYCVVRK